MPRKNLPSLHEAIVVAPPPWLVSVITKAASVRVSRTETLSWMMLVRETRTKAEE